MARPSNHRIHFLVFAVERVHIIKWILVWFLYPHLGFIVCEDTEKIALGVPPLLSFTFSNIMLMLCSFHDLDKFCWPDRKWVIPRWGYHNVTKIGRFAFWAERVTMLHILICSLLYLTNIVTLDMDNWLLLKSPPILIFSVTTLLYHPVTSDLPKTLIQGALFYLPLFFSLNIATIIPVQELFGASQGEPNIRKERNISPGENQKTREEIVHGGKNEEAGTAPQGVRKILPGERNGEAWIGTNPKKECQVKSNQEKLEEENMKLRSELAAAKSQYEALCKVLSHIIDLHIKCEEERRALVAELNANAELAQIFQSLLRDL